MAFRISGWVVRVCGSLGLIVGLITWITGIKGALIPIHMLLGLLIVVALWIMGGVMAAVKGGNIGLGLGAIILGILTLWLGLTQTSLLLGSLHWLIQVIHLLLGLTAIGLGEMITARYKRRVLSAKIQA